MPKAIVRRSTVAAAAKGSTAVERRNAFDEAIRRRDEITKLLHQARGICALATLVPLHWDEVPDDAQANALWAAQDLIGRANDLAEEILSGVRRG